MVATPMPGVATRAPFRNFCTRNTSSFKMLASPQKDRKAIFLFIVLALGLSVCYWLQRHFWPQGILPSAVEVALESIFRGFGPAISAVIAVLYARGTSGLKELGASILRYKVSWKLYLLAFLGSMAVTGLGAALAYYSGATSFTTANVIPIRLIFIFIFMAFLDGPLGEEVGWRGFLLPRLLEIKGPIAASLIVGCVWYLWHLPLYAVSGRITSPESLLLFFVSTNALSVIFTWFFRQSGQSTFFMVFLHTCSNYPIYLSRILFPQIGDASIRTWIYYPALVILAIAAGIALIRKPKQ